MKIIDKFFMDKKGSGVIYILLALGIIMLISGGALSKTKKEAPQSPKQADISIEPTVEEKLEKTLSEIKGAGKVTVMTTALCGEKDILGYDTDGKSKKTVILNKDGGETPLVTQKIPAELTGIIIVADGAKNTSVRKALIDAAGIVTGVPPHKIAVFEREENQ